MWKSYNPWKKIENLKQYEKIYDWKDIVLYNSYCLEDENIEE